MPKKKQPATPPLPVPYRKQIQSSDCLAACATMLIEYLGRSVPYPQLLALLEIGPLGAPRRNILRLARLGFQVTFREGTLPVVAQYVNAGHPVIAFVDTGELSYWSTTTNHAVVVVGVESDHVLVLDPAFPDDAPKQIPEGEFQLAWLNCDYTCAIVEV
jgi:ABC-type bacteriocin/lantibiotic exporter with double-glycine peptidase domain